MEDSYYAIDRSKVVHDTIDGETIVINLDSGAYYALNPTAGEIWNWIDRGAGTHELSGLLEERYSVEPGQIAAALPAFLEQLVNEALLLSVSEAPANAGHNGWQAAQDGPAERPAFTAPAISIFTDMADFLKVDPIHEVDEQGWPYKKTDEA
jgi:hypothetical protein